MALIKIFSWILLFEIVLGQCPVDEGNCYPDPKDLVEGMAIAERSLTVTSTCGSSGSTTYRSYVTTDSTDYTCASGAHPQENMIDKSYVTIDGIQYPSPNFATYWQSENTILAAAPEQIAAQNIIFDFTDTFLIQEVQVYFAAPDNVEADRIDGRSDAICIEYFSNPEWKPWRYFAVDCGLFPNVPALSSTSSPDPLTAYCEEFTRGTFTGNIPIIEEHPSLQFFPEFFANKDIQDLYTTSAVRLRLTRPASTDPPRSYHAISDIKITGHCPCYGHADTCTGTNENVCDCQHNTMGDHCEQCQDLFNNKTWRVGTLQESNACEACDCNQLATSCVYDVVKQHGVCVNCSGNTDGDFCKDCKSGYFINPSTLPESGVTQAPPGTTCSGHNGVATVDYDCNSYCIACDCSGTGTLSSSNWICDATTGLCDCKANVQGRKCDQCKDGFHSLSAANSDGCQGCDCDMVGTTQSADFCGKSDGQCICKTNVQGVRCDQCKPGTYNLQQTNVDGCLACGCNSGGATDNSCNIVTGQCNCRPRITGKDCSQAEPGYFVPELDYFTLDAEFGELANGASAIDVAGHGTSLTGKGYAELPPGGSVAVTVDIPVGVSGLFTVVVRYKSDVATGVSVTTNVEMVNGVQYACSADGQTYPANQVWTQALMLTGPSPKSTVSMTTDVCLKDQQTYKVTLTCDAANTENTFIDSIVFVPEIGQLLAYTVTTEEVKTNMTSCRTSSMGVDPDMRQTLACAPLEFSLMAEFFNTALPCQCKNTGTVDGSTDVCESQGGQCPCKESIILRDCALCKVDSYGGTENSVCIACNCHPTGSVAAACDQSGICDCRANIMGDKCDSCIPDHYGLQTGTGCVPCTCSPEYSINNQCTDEGKCSCKPGVGGDQCTECSDGNHTLTIDGCTACECNEDGSVDNVCAKDTGKCQCKDGVEGDRCDQCKAGYFGLGPWAAMGCLPCYCSGTSTTCVTASGWFKTTTESVWIPPNADGERWTGQDGQAANVALNFLVLFGIGDPQYVMRFVNTATYQAEQNVYFVAPAKFLGNKKTAYGQLLTVEHAQSSLDSPLPAYTEGDVILKGKGQTYMLTANILTTPGLQKTVNRITLTETSWYVDTTDGVQATFEQMMQTLLSLESLKIRAKYGNTPDATNDLYRVELQHGTRDEAASSGVALNNAEACTCTEVRRGDDCELCGFEYRRTDPSGPLQGPCESCQCNGHAGGPCDEQTGVCTCTNNTEGDQCERCMPMYYGNALLGQPDDCKPCTCPGNVVTGDVNVFATECTPGVGTNGPKCTSCATGHSGDTCNVCANGYFGEPENAENNEGKCTPCNCNGRAATCDTMTGDCIDCTGNTQGPECNECAPGFYGNPADCQQCNCVASVGSSGECNSQTGACTCKPNVEGATCDRCVADAYNFDSGAGCTLCECSPEGSLATTCDNTGQCSCRNHVMGLRCDSCDVGFWQVNAATGCNECGCNPEGSDPAANGACNLETGQCQCKSAAFMGLKCDTCAPASAGTYQHLSLISLGAFPNCALCGECFDHWAVKVDQMAIEVYAQDSEVDTLHANYGRLTIEFAAPTLGHIRNNIMLAQESIYKAGNFTQMLNNVKTSLQQIAVRATALDAAANAHQEQYDADLVTYQDLTTFTGSTQLVDSSTISLASLDGNVRSLATSIENQYTLAMEIWNRIQDLSILVSDTGDRARELQTKVDTAMSDLQVAVDTHALMVNLHDQSFQQSYDANQNALNTAQNILDTAQTRLNELKSILQTVTQQFNMANSAMSTVSATAASQRDAMVALRDSSVYTKDYAQGVLDNVVLTLTIVNDYYMESMYGATNLTKAFKDVILGINALTDQTSKLANIQAKVAKVAAISLRPLSDMTAITGEIETLTVDVAAVADIQQKTTTAQTTAENAMTATQQARDDAQRTVEEVQTIQNDITEASTIRAETTNLRTAGESKRQEIQTTILQVQDKATQISNLATQAGTNANSVSGKITTATTCFNQRAIEAGSTKTAAQQGLDTAIEAEQNLQTVAQVPAAIAVQITQNAHVTTSKTSIESTSADLEAVTTSLDNVEAIADLQAILLSYQNQQVEIQQLEQEITQLETDLDTAIAELNTKLAVSTRQCTIN